MKWLKINATIPQVEKDNGVAGGNQPIAPSMTGAWRVRPIQLRRPPYLTKAYRMQGRTAPITQKTLKYWYMDPVPNILYGPMTPQTIDDEKKARPFGQENLAG